MASARSTVSIARTTPAQKPRGEHNNTFSCGFSEGWGDVMSISIQGFSDELRAKVATTGFGFLHAPVKHAGGGKAKVSLW